MTNTSHHLYLSKRTQALILTSGAIGNFLEAYDVMICAFLAKILSLTFFPTNSLLPVFYIFLVGYLSRPIGSLIVSLYGDSIGRKKIFIASILILGFSTTAIGLIPSYNTIGFYAVILFFCCRILQNI